MTPELKDYWMRIVAAVFLMKMASSLMRDAEKMLAQSLRAKDDTVAATLNGNGSEANAEVVFTPDEESIVEGTDDE